MQCALLCVSNVRDIVGLLIPYRAFPVDGISSVEISVARVTVVLSMRPKAHLETVIRGVLDPVLRVPMDGRAKGCNRLVRLLERWCECPNRVLLGWSVGVEQIKYGKLFVWCEANHIPGATITRKICAIAQS